MAELDWDGDATIARVSGASERALAAGAEHLLAESNRLAPIETGALIRSGTTIARGDEAAVGYTSVYAARQHEEVGWQHDQGRQAKFLETALEASRDDILAAITDQLRDALGG